MLRLIVALVVGAHGIGHVLFLVPLLSGVDWGQSTRSWLVTGDSAARLVGAVVWVVALAAFGAAVVGLLMEQDWWRGAAVIGAIVSTGGLLLFWSNPPTSSVIAALVFNLLVLGALLVARWPSAAAVGA